MIKVTFKEDVTQTIEVEVPEELFGDDPDFFDDPPDKVREFVYNAIDGKGWTDKSVHESFWEVEEPEEPEFMEDDEED
jgi:hypothetical protein